MHWINYNKIIQHDSDTEFCTSKTDESNINLYVLLYCINIINKYIQL